MIHLIKHSMLAITLSTSTTLAAPPATSTSDTETVPIEASVTYKQVPLDAPSASDKRSLRIDWTRPADWQASDARGAVVFFHGGGWVGGKPGQFAEHSTALADLGLVCFRVEYRLLDRKNGEPPTDCVEDASDAMRFIRGSAKRFGIDPHRIACGGGSAGGHLAAYLGMMDDEEVDGVSRKADALLLFNPVYDNGPGQWGAKRVGEQTDQYSPAHNITSDDPPAIVFLGESDALIPMATAERFQQRSQQADLVSELHTYPDQPHGFFNVHVADGKYFDDTLGKSIAFLKRLGWMDAK
ncbi:alpha/beta hydrolase [Allorhodopirellula solitaria]|uniref:Acetylxylan esterase n=1 Tax=Allorhodopirellula solitaria TaxID=2527987 RepID=A0A5C5WZR5_9BACT|nr:alpha/beta hydrolase [Allorhodopirellula solitaria]TWT56156.1 Acetylxylan esterase precursor [Allorhodopirellula solitaria]